ncbi:MAG: DUF2752 domain-containing protein [Bacilli bacterium]|nr:DUF2752 domain-containing protein [Bacilli bacterium]
MKKIKEDFHNYRISIFVILIYLLFMNLIFHNVCPIKILFKIDCPGCGLTRAILSFLKGDIIKSLEYNYTYPFWIITIILFFVDRYFYKLKIKPFPTLFIITSIITLLRYFINIFL